MIPNTPPYDPRAIANALLKKAKSSEYELTNLSLQKLLYFVHSLYLIEERKPLLRGHFEAWQYGPVHPAVYETFKACGPNTIEHLARSFDFSINSYKDIPEIADITVNRLIDRVISNFGAMRPSQLVKLTHAKGGAWQKTVNKAETSVALGLRISNDDTIALYGKMKLDLSASEEEKIYENSPFT